MILGTKRLVIRRVIEEDWKSIKEIWEDFNASPFHFYDTQHKTDENDVRKRISKWAAFCESTEHMFYAVCADKRVIGYIAFNIRECGHEIGYCFHSDFHGRGFAKESMLALFDYVRELGIKKLIARTAINNTPSVALLRALGFKLIEKEQVSFYKDENGNDIVFEGGVFERNLEFRFPEAEGR